MDTKDLARIKTCFVISGDNFHPDEFTQAIGISPTSYHVKDTVLEEERPPAPISEWILESDWDSKDNIDDGIKEILEILQPFISKITEFCNNQNLGRFVISAVEIYTDRPELVLSEESVSKMAVLGVEYSIDLYDYRE